ncbi:abortive infection family protein [Phenylobacterium sp.]|uniref:abortive infection family protein n=1 Tax=Phenylobacterium sp. TaxID=1871053 RepID=UPI0035653FCE
MRRILSGIAYDTETAEFVASGSHGEDAPSAAYWQLYRTDSGAWFEVVADHEGIVEAFVALTSDEASKWLERNANHLVERYFGRMPELLPKEPDGVISAVTRRNIFDAIALQGINWSGRMAEDEFLLRVFDLEQLPSNDHRFKTMRGDVWQHRVNNPNDWEDDWVFSDRRLSLLSAPNEVFLKFLSEIAHPLVQPDQAEAEAFVALANRHLARDGFQLAVVDTISGRNIYAGGRTLSFHSDLNDARRVADALSSSQVFAQITRMKDSVERDPALAIGSAKEFVETICKAILEARGVAPTGYLDFQPLVTMTREALALKVDPAAERTLKSLLGALGTIVNSIAELRGQLGTGHGAAANAPTPPVEIARLAVGVATSLGVFLWERHRAHP